MSSRGRPFQPGNKLGRGRPLGSRNKNTAQIQDLLHEYAPSLMRKALAEALQGDVAILRFFLDRVITRRSVQVRIGALPARTAEDIAKSSEKIVKQVAAGKLPIAEGEQVLSILELRRRAIETEQFEQRLRTLERNHEPANTTQAA